MTNKRYNRELRWWENVICLIVIVSFVGVGVYNPEYTFLGGFLTAIGGHILFYLYLYFVRK